MLPDVRNIVACLWGAAGVVWFVGALGAKRTARIQTRSSRLLQLALAALALAIGFAKPFQFGLLAKPFVPASASTAYAGLFATLLGIGFAVWARLSLGRNWSGAVTVKIDHTLIKNGPYAIVRHPIYSGFLLAVLGTAIAFNEVRVLVTVALAFVHVWTKVRIEERLMAEEFGSEYTEYCRHVKAFIPFVY